MILVWKAKNSDYFVYARNPEEELRAYMLLFHKMDEAGYYSTVYGQDGLQYDAAKRGSMQAAKNLLIRRSDLDYEYEQIYVEYPVVPN